MSPLLKFILRRLLLIPVTLFIITVVMYATVTLTPVETRAQLYLPNSQARLTEEQLQRILQRIIRTYGLNDPFPVQYASWIGSLVNGQWGYSPTLNAPVYELIGSRAAVTLELTMWAVITYIPTGLVAGIVAGWRRSRRADHVFRLTAFTATSIPSFILGLMMLSFLYVGLGWAGPGRLSGPFETVVTGSGWREFTGLFTIDGLLNGRFDIALDALQHLLMPVIALSALHWATVGRVTRAAMIEEIDKPYIIAAQARGVSEWRLYWKHAFRNAIAPGLTSSVLSAASLLTGVFVIERVFNLHGVSELIVASGTASLADAPAALGFGVFSVIVVLIIMFVLDVAQAVVDPRLREGVTD